MNDKTTKTSISQHEERKNMGNEAYKKGLYGQAIDYYSDAINLQNNIATYYGNRAAARIAVQQYKQALEDCKMSIQLDNNFMKGYIRLSVCLTQLGQMNEALNTLSIIENPSKIVLNEMKRVEEVKNNWEKAQNLIENKEYKVAIPILTQLLGDCSQFIDVRLNLVQALIDQDQNDSALSICNALYKENNNNINVIYWRGVCLYHAGNLNTAVKHCQEVLRRDPDNTLARILFKLIRKLEDGKARGNALYKQGKIRDAIECFTETMNMDKNNRLFNAQLYCNRAAAHQKLKIYTEAINDCKEAINLKPNYIKAIVRLGTCQVESGEYEDGLRTLEQAQSKDSSFNGINEKVRWAKLELKKSKRKDYYKILGISKDATSCDIKKAYRKNALRWHPDKNRGDPEQEQKAEAMFKDIGEAYNILSDDKLRQRYDSGVDLQDEPMAHPDMNDLFQMFFQQASGNQFGFQFG